MQFTCIQNSAVSIVLKQSSHIKTGKPTSGNGIVIPCSLRVCLRAAHSTHAAPLAPAVVFRCLGRCSLSFSTLPHIQTSTHKLGFLEPSALDVFCSCLNYSKAEQSDSVYKSSRERISAALRVWGLPSNWPSRNEQWSVNLTYQKVENKNP